MIANILSRLSKVASRSNDEWLACCPAHEDKTPSLAIRQSSDGKILLHCFAGCSIEEITDALGLSLNKLFPDNGFNHNDYHHQLKQSQYKEILSNEQLVVAIAEAEIKRNHKLNAKNTGRHLLALSRIKKLEILINV